MVYEKLCRAIEQQLHREMHTPADFDYLSEKIMERTGSSVSTATLMRLWGYRPSVAVRMSTLDILARFIGYNDYTHFRAENREEGAESKNGQGKSSTRHRSLLLFVTAAAVLLLVSFLLLHTIKGGKRQEQPQPHYITSLSELSNNRQYLIHTRKKHRGSLGICGRHLGTTFDKAVLYRCNEASPFALIQNEGCFYLFSVQEGCFVNVLNYLTKTPLRRDFGERDWCAFNLRPERGGFVFDFKSATGIYTLNVAAFDGIIIDDWGTTNGVYDDGNLFMLEDAGPFDPKEAFSLF